MLRGAIFKSILDMAKKTIVSLSVDELCSYLLVKLPDLESETIEAFRFHKVNGETFLQLTDDDIRELTARLGERKAIKRLIDSSADVIFCPQHIVTETHTSTGQQRSAPCYSTFVSPASKYSLSTTNPHHQPPLSYVAVGRGSSSRTPPPDSLKASLQHPPAIPHRVAITTAVQPCTPQTPPPTIQPGGLAAVPSTTPPATPTTTLGAPSNWIRTFKIPDFSFRTQQALKNGVITKGASSDIVTYIAHQIWTHTKYPTSEEYTEVCRELVTQYPVLKDGTSTGYVSWKRRLQQKFKNLRRPNRAARLRCKGGGGPDMQLGGTDREVQEEGSESEGDGDDGEGSGDLYVMTPPHHHSGMAAECGEPLRKKRRGSTEQPTAMTVPASSRHGSAHSSTGDGYGPLHIEEMSSFYNESSVSSYHDSWPDVKLKMPALDET